jgi:hypothetical protein
VEDQERPVQAAQPFGDVVLLDVVQELVLDGERTARQHDFGFAALDDLFQLVGEIVHDVRRAARAADGRHGAHGRQVLGRFQRSRTAKAVPDDQARRVVIVFQILRRRPDLRHVRGEVRIGKITARAAQPRKVEAQHPVAFVHQGLRDRLQRLEVLPDRKTVREHDIIDDLAVLRQIEPSRQRMTQRAGEGEAFGFHGTWLHTMAPPVKPDW